MRVMCIRITTRIDPRVRPDEIPVIGSSYTVHEQYNEDGIDVYIIEEMPRDTYYSVDLFAPLSTIDERELVKEKEVCDVAV